QNNCIPDMPWVLGDCEHLYCRQCCDDLLGQCCVICGIPVHVKDARMHRLVSNIVEQFKIMNRILQENFLVQESGIAKAGETTNCDFHTDHSNSSNNTSTNISSEFQYNLNDAAGSPELFGPDSPIKLSNHTDSPAKREQLEEASNLHARHVPETGEELAINLLFTGDNSSLSGNCQGTESKPVNKSNENIIQNCRTAARKINGAKQNIQFITRKKTIKRSLKRSLGKENTHMSSPSSRKCSSTTPFQLGSPSHMNLSFNNVWQGSPHNIDKKNAKGETSLQVACIKGDLQRVERLLSSGANPNTRDHAGWTPLHEACQRGHAEIAARLLSAGALVDVPGTENETPLHDAVRHLKTDCVTLLVRHGASINTRNINGLSPLDLAGGHSDLMEVLHTEVQGVITPLTLQVDPLVYQSPCFLGTGLSREQRSTLQKCASKLQARVVEGFCPEVTHVVSGCNNEGLCPRTIKYLQGVLSGRWIVNMEWVEMSLEYGSKLVEEAFEIPGTSTDPQSGAAQKGRINRQKQLPGLFDGCQFYFYGHFEYPTPDREDLVSLVKLGGGQVIQREPKPGHIPETQLTTPYHAPAGSETCCIYIVHDNRATFQPITTSVLCTVRAAWIMDCISQFRLINVGSDC
uniref:BRCT domain-containing protein n=1 Tax=Magallana gigas TaxID=29159 RepID=A0A8W8M9T6_MAGGI